MRRFLGAGTNNFTWIIALKHVNNPERHTLLGPFYAYENMFREGE